MKEVTLKFDLMCDKHDKDPVYRIFVDDELLTERTYIWYNSEYYLRENLPMRLEEGKHTLKVKCVDSPNARLSINNVRLNNKKYELIDGKDFIV